MELLFCSAILSVLLNPLSRPPRDSGADAASGIGATDCAVADRPASDRYGASADDVAYDLQDAALHGAGIIAMPLRDPGADRRVCALVCEHRQRLYRFVLRSVGNPSDAEDIAQQTFVEACRAISSFRGESELSTWLYGIAMNLVRNYLNRAPHRVREYEPVEVLDALEDDADGPETRLQRLQMMGLLSNEVERLSDDLRQIFLLVAIDGASYEEAAETLKIPTGTVRSRLFRAREAIKGRLPHLQDWLRA